MYVYKESYLEAYGKKKDTQCIGKTLVSPRILHRQKGKKPVAFFESIRLKGPSRQCIVSTSKSLDHRRKGNYSESFLKNTRLERTFFIEEIPT